MQLDRESLKSLIDVDFFIKQYAPDLEKKAAAYHGRCPFPGHNDKNPSFSFCHTGKYRTSWICACGKGDIMDFLNRKGIDGDDAIQILNDLIKNKNVHLRSVAESIKDVLKKKKEKNQPNVSALPMVRRIKSLMVRYLMEKRKYSLLDALKVIKKYNLSVFAEEKFHNWIVIPVYDENKKQVTWVAQHPTRKKKNKYNPPGGSMDYLFNINNIPKGKRWVIVVESFWCAIRLNSWGWPAVSMFGARMSKRQAKMICERFDRVYLCYDKNKAGRGAEGKAVRALSPQVNIFYMRLESEDCDKATEEEVNKAIENATTIKPIWDFDNGQ